MVCCGHSSCYEFSVPFSRRRCACFLRFKPHGCFLWLCNCTDFCSSVLRRLHNDILLLVILSLLVLLCSNFLCLDAFMLISILIDCSFHSYCPCLHCFSHHYSVACFASIAVVVVPFWIPGTELKATCLSSAIGRVETSVSHRRSH